VPDQKFGEPFEVGGTGDGGLLAVGTVPGNLSRQAEARSGHVIDEIWTG
jgi:hypothetical protein